MRGRESPRGPPHLHHTRTVQVTTGEKDQLTLPSEKQILCHLRTQSQRTSLRLWLSSPRTVTAYTTSAKNQTEKEFSKIAIATSVGLLMGFLGFFVKLIHIPINQIIVGS